eukprot:TRINITY_DN14151_c0_g1_i1.p1 TRINITY_DN14151_c0_g1~~TRINITY_DN14151_c0_g1_i1.p1  ORF type:complete len:328 (-),score=43.83 TRINITY_DN14151_c0_g1_i1:65-1048(-)
MINRGFAAKSFHDSVASKLLAASQHVVPGSARLQAGGLRGCDARSLRVSKSGLGSVEGNPNADCILEVIDVSNAVSGEIGTEKWTAKVKVILQQSFKRFSPVLDVRIPTAVAIVRFANSKGPEAVMVAAPKGFLALGEGVVRVRAPGAADNVWRKFPPPRREEASSAVDSAEKQVAEPESKRRKLRPNERFKVLLPGKRDDEDESERFWEQQHEKRKEPIPPVAPPPLDPPPDQAPPAPPTKPMPTMKLVESDGSAEDMAVARGEAEISDAMTALLELPFSQQRKTLRGLRRHWHPDKRPDDQEVATRVFHFIQAHEAWLEHHGLAS